MNQHRVRNNNNSLATFETILWIIAGISLILALVFLKKKWNFFEEKFYPSDLKNRETTYWLFISKILMESSLNETDSKKLM
jgi:hypothetical protein